MSVEWRDPPPAARGPMAADAQIPDQLRTQPGKWAMIKTANMNASAVTYAKSRREKWGPKYEVVARGREVFARFIGDPL